MKMEWIDGGVFAELCKIVCLHGGQVKGAKVLYLLLLSLTRASAQPNEPKEPIKICKRLLDGNPEGCLVLSRVLLTHLRQHVDCVSSYLFVQQVISIPAFELVFLQNRGAHFLVDFYEKTCVILHGRNYDRSLDFTQFVEAIKEEPSETERRDQQQQSSNNSEDQDPPGQAAAVGSRGSSSSKAGRNLRSAANSETGDDESSLSGSAPVTSSQGPPPGPVQTPRTEKREVLLFVCLNLIVNCLLLFSLRKPLKLWKSKEWCLEMPKSGLPLRQCKQSCKV